MPLGAGDSSLGARLQVDQTTLRKAGSIAVFSTTLIWPTVRRSDQHLRRSRHRAVHRMRTHHPGVWAAELRRDRQKTEDRRQTTENTLATV
jgi:hypothetical protein